MHEHPFFQMIQQLLKKEEVLLYANILEISAQDRQKTQLFLEVFYQSESSHYPYQIPVFDAEAAIWAAEVAYLAAQLILFRKNDVAELPKIFPADIHPLTPATMLSADLCLRFLPDMLTQLKLIDDQDELIEMLEAYLKKWQYSSLPYKLTDLEINLSPFWGNDCVKQLFLDRFVQYKRTEVAQIPEVAKALKSNFGIHEAKLWKV